MKQSKWIPLLGLPFITLKCQVHYRGINTGTVTLKHKIGSNPSLEVGRLRLHIWDLMKHDLEEHCWLPNLLETYAEWIRHVSCSQMPKNVIIFLLVLLNSFLSAVQRETSLFAKTSNHGFVWKTTSPSSVHLPTKLFLFFSSPVFWG